MARLTPEQIAAELERRKAARDPAAQAAPSPPPAPPAKEPWYEDAAEGFAAGTMETAYGLKDLMGMGTDIERSRLKDYQQDAAQSGWGTAGRVGSEIAQLAIPAGLATKAARGLKLLKNVGAKGRYALGAAGDTALITGQGYARLPEKYESRLVNAAKSGAAGLGGAAAAKVLGPLVGKSMFKLSDEAKSLLDEGVYLTPGQAANSKAISGLETVMEVTPVLSRGTKSARARGANEWGDSVVRKSVPAHLKATISGRGHEAVQTAKNAIRDGYEAAWSKGGGLDDVTKQTLLRDIKAAKKTLPVEDQYVLTRLKENVKKHDPTSNLRLLDDAFRRAEKASKGRHYLQGEVNKLRETLRNALPQEAKDAVTVMDEAYPKYLAVQKAASAAAKDKGHFTPQQLIQASRSVGKESKAARGLAPLQKEAEGGLATVGKKVGGMPLEFMRRVADISPTPLPMQTMGDVMMGQTAMQKRIAELLRDKEFSLYLTGARTGAAIED